jgi:hypothetical protein
MTEELKTTAAKAANVAASETKPNASRTPASDRKEKSKTKSSALIALLSRPRGATLDEMMKATGWQAHSVRGFLAGTVRKQLGRPVTSEVTDKGRVYRVLKAQ